MLEKRHKRAHIYREKIEIKIYSRYETDKKQEHFLVFEIRQNFSNDWLIYYHERENSYW